MIIADFQVENKANRSRFLQKIFLVIDTKFEVILEMLFLKISNMDMSFGEKTLIWKTYTTNKILPTTKQVQIIDLEEFVIATLYIDNKTFVMHIAI